MKESVALDKNAEVNFQQSVKNIKKLIKKGEIKLKAVKEVKSKKKDGKRHYSLERGVVYLGHLPHGFYEEQLKDYLTQFGKVLRVQVARSPKTGKSKGFAFVEFAEIDVAKIVAETMNNYLMMGRLLKAEYIPPDKQKRGIFNKKIWTEEKFPTKDRRVVQNQLKNKRLNAEQEKKVMNGYQDRLEKMKTRLSLLGVDISYFEPNDIPALAEDEDLSLIVELSESVGSDDSVGSEKSMEIDDGNESKEEEVFPQLPVKSANLNKKRALPQLPKNKGPPKTKTLQQTTKITDAKAQNSQKMKASKVDKLLQRKDGGGIEKKTQKVNNIDINKAKNVKKTKMAADATIATSQTIPKVKLDKVKTQNKSKKSRK